jgi:hypothetical protein
MKSTATAGVALVLVFTAALAHAQNAGTPPVAPLGDSAVSPAAASLSAANSADGSHQRLGAGIASGAVNNGTTGDTIGTGHGTSSAPDPKPAATAPSTGR